MLSKCEKRLYIQADYCFLSDYKQELERLSAEGKKVVILTDADLSIKDAIVYKTAEVSGQIRFITDSSYVLTGDITGSEYDTCLFSAKRNLVEVVKESLRNRIYMIDQITNQKER